MDFPADSLPGDHLRPEEKEAAKDRLRLHMQANPAQAIHNSTFQEAFREAMSVADEADVLLPHEKVQVREYLVRYMEENAAMVANNATFTERFAESFASFSRMLIPQTVATFCVIGLMGGGIAWAAEDTLPGDMLYSVKTGIVEPIRQAMVNDPAAKAQRLIECTRKRLLETEKLLSGERLTADSWAVLRGNIVRTVGGAERAIAAVAVSDPVAATDLSSDLNVLLDAHSNVFDDVGMASDNSVVLNAALDMQVEADRVALFHAENEKIVLDDDEKAETVAHRVVQSVSDAVDALSDSNASEAVAVRIGAAKELLQKAQENLKDKKFGDSLGAARMAIRKAEEGAAFARLKLPVFMISAPADASSSSDSEISAVSSASVRIPVVVPKETDSSSVDISTASISSRSKSVSSSTHKEQSSSASVTRSSSSALSSEAAVSSATTSSVELPIDLPIDLPVDLPNTVPVVPSILP